MLLDFGYVVDNVLLRGRVRNVERLYDGANFSHRDLIFRHRDLFFRHQLRFLIRFDRKRLDNIAFNKRWMHAATMFVRKGAILESSFPVLPAHGSDGLGHSGPHLE